LADAIRNVPGAASAAIRMKFAASDPLSIIWNFKLFEQFEQFEQFEHSNNCLLK
jgi:hypothetical protein